jgi:5-methylthioadenosine/S-adenosylhomocysteine deaminase
MSGPLRYTAPMPSEPSALLVAADWILPIVPRGVVHEGHALALSGGRIDDLGPRESMRARYPAHRFVDLPGHALMPGLVNAHGHLAMTLLRGLAEDLPLEEWLKDRIWPIEGRLMSESFVADGTALAMLELLGSGTTTASDMYFFPERSAALAREARMRAQICFPVIGHGNAWSASAADALHRGLALHDEYRDDPLVTIAFGPHSTYALERDDLDRVFMLADEIDAAVQIHLHEGENEVHAARVLTGRTPIEALATSGHLTPRLQAVHATTLAESDIDRLATGGVGVVHCPHSNLKLGTGICPVTDLLARGMRVGLGSDGAASNNSLDLFAELRTATLLAKTVRRDARALPAAAALEMATLGGAAVLGLAREIGSLEPGKAADVIAVDLGAAGALPVHRPEVALVHGQAGSWVRHVWIAGEAVVTDGRVLTLDAKDIRARAMRWRRQIATQMGAGELRRAP